jgi:hypothetical protein
MLSRFAAGFFILPRARSGHLSEFLHRREQRAQPKQQRLLEQFIRSESSADLHAVAKYRPA